MKKAPFDERRENWQRLAETATPPVPSTLQARLRDYQAGFSWLARFSSWGMVAFLADDMGLGKQQIVALHARKRDLADSLLEGTDLAGKISAAELLALLRDQKDPFIDSHNGKIPGSEIRVSPDQR